jgi:hypothetical protein
VSVKFSQIQHHGAIKQSTSCGYPGRRANNRIRPPVPEPWITHERTSGFSDGCISRLIICESYVCTHIRRVRILYCHHLHAIPKSRTKRDVLVSCASLPEVRITVIRSAVKYEPAPETISHSCQLISRVKLISSTELFITKARIFMT